MSETANIQTKYGLLTLIIQGDIGNTNSLDEPEYEIGLQMAGRMHRIAFVDPADYQIFLAHLTPQVLEQIVESCGHNRPQSADMPDIRVEVHFDDL